MAPGFNLRFLSKDVDKHQTFRRSFLTSLNCQGFLCLFKHVYSVCVCAGECPASYQFGWVDKPCQMSIFLDSGLCRYHMPTKRWHFEVSLTCLVSGGDGDWWHLSHHFHQATDPSARSAANACWDASICWTLTKEMQGPAPPYLGSPQQNTPPLLNLVKHHLSQVATIVDLK